MRNSTTSEPITESTIAQRARARDKANKLASVHLRAFMDLGPNRQAEEIDRIAERIADAWNAEWRAVLSGRDDGRSA